MRPPGLPRFLTRGPYRRRRVADAARILPFVTALLFLLPVLWDTGATPEGDTARGAVYLFVVWAGAVAAAFVFARRLGGQDDREGRRVRPDGREGGA